MTDGAMVAMAVKAAEPSVAAKILSTTQAIILSPIFGIVVLGGIIGYELWKGKKDAADFQTVKAVKS